MKNIVIVGGGASGISAALSAARRAPKDTRITLLEGLDRVGKKILATGNGRCNLTNEEITPEHYHSGRPELLAPLLAEMPPSARWNSSAPWGSTAPQKRWGGSTPTPGRPRRCWTP